MGVLGPELWPNARNAWVAHPVSFLGAVSYDKLWSGFLL